MAKVIITEVANEMLCAAAADMNIVFSGKASRRLLNGEVEIELDDDLIVALEKRDVNLSAAIIQAVVEWEKRK